MNSKLLVALLGFAGLASLGRAAVVVVDPLCAREVVVRSSYRAPGRIVYVQPEPARPRFGWYERVFITRRDGCREIRYVHRNGWRR
jgi:siroheme synthase